MIAARSVALLRVVAPLAALSVLAQIGYPLVDGTVRDRLTVVTVLLFAATSLSHALVTRGARVAVALLVVCAGGGLLAEAVGTRTGQPFGEYQYAGRLGPTLLGVPLVIPLGWVMLAWPAYLVAARLTGPAGPARRLLVAGWALAAWDLFLDPQMVAAGYWRWSDPSPGLPGAPGVPLTNYAGWLLVAVLMVAAFEVAAGPDAQSPPPGPADRVPYLLYVWTWASSVLAHLAFLGLPGSALWGGLGMGMVAVPLLRARWQRAAPAPAPLS